MTSSARSQIPPDQRYRQEEGKTERDPNQDHRLRVRLLRRRLLRRGNLPSRHSVDFPFLRLPLTKGASAFSDRCPKARRNASDAGGNAGDLTSAGLPSASASSLRMASDRDGRGSGCAAIHASSDPARLDGRRKPINSPCVTPSGRPRFFVKLLS
jgi:hypothetical protein